MSLEDQEFPRWVRLRGPPQEAYLENSILAEWAGRCPYCSAPEMLIGWMRVLEAQQRGMKLIVGDGVFRGDVLFIVTRVRAGHILGRAVAVGGTIADRRFLPEVELQRDAVVVADRQFLHPAPLCRGFATQGTKQTLAAVVAAFKRASRPETFS